MTLKGQEARGSKVPPHASQVMGAAARVEAATRMIRAHGQVAAIRLVLRRVVVRHPDVNESDWDCTLENLSQRERVGPAAAGQREGEGLRPLGLS